MSEARASSLLVGDIGGTNVRLALVDRGPDGSISLRARFKRPAEAFSSFDQSVSAFLSELDDHPYGACFALAGPVDAETVTLTNREWRVSRAGLRSTFGFERVALVNDFAALARGAVETPASGFQVLKLGAAVDGEPIIIGGPGTGFGMAIAARFDGVWRILAGEGGHQSFAPQTAFEWEVASALRSHVEHVSTELIAAGLYTEIVREIVCAVLGAPFTPMSPADVLAAAEAGDAAALAYCRLRADAVMAALGDAALLAGARGGAVIAGGVAQGLKNFLSAPRSLERFASHGPMSDYLADAPVKLLIDEDAALIGAAHLFEEMQMR